MSGFPIVDLVVGMIFIYFLLSIICSSAVEILLTVFKVRAKVLEEWFITIFSIRVTNGGNTTIPFGQALLDHCSLTALSGKGNAPSYVDASNFVSALLEKVTLDPKSPKSIAKDLDGYMTAIENSDVLSDELKRVILIYANDARETYKSLAVKTQSEIDLFRHKIETWYDTNMDRVSGTLKSKYSRRITFWFAAFTAILLNADSISICQYLYNNTDQRTKLVEKAYATAVDTTVSNKMATLRLANPGDSMTLKQVQDAIMNKALAAKQANAALNDYIPLGWNAKEYAGKKGNEFDFFWLTKLIGLTATILAICMGAPFWFDLLNKIANIRGSGTKPTTTSEKQSKLNTPSA